MGTLMAPSYANLFVGKLEQEFLQTQNKVPLVWWRYSDDVFTMWTHGKPVLQSFMDSVNQHHTTIKFTVTWLAEEVTLLETWVYN